MKLSSSSRATTNAASDASLSYPGRGNAPFALLPPSDALYVDKRTLPVPPAAEIAGEVMAETVHFMVERGVPVCAHIGLTPQSVHALGGYRVQGRDDASASRMKREARALEEAGAALVKATHLTPATVNKSLAHLERIGIVGELTNRQRGRVFSYLKYVEELAAELEAPA